MKKLMILSLIIITSLGGVAKAGESVFKWKSSSLFPNGTVVQACVGDNVTLPWSFDMTSSKQCVIQWSKTSKDREKLLVLASYSKDTFFELWPERDLEFLSNAGIKLPKVTLADTGMYTVEIFLFGRPEFYKQVAFLQVSDVSVITSEEFRAFILPELVYNSTTRLWHVQLGCRPPVVRGQSALPVIWTTPSHRRAFSTSFKNNTFILELPLPLEEGDYTCSLNRSVPAVKCLSTLLNTSRVATVNVKAVGTRLSYLEGSVETLLKETAVLNGSLCHLTDFVQQLQSKNKKCCEEFINVNQTTEDTNSALQNLQIKNDKLTSKINLLESITTTAQIKYDNMSTMVLSKFDNLTDAIQRKNSSMTALEQSKFDTLTAMVQNISAVVDTNNDSITAMVQSKFDTITAMVKSISAVVDTNNDSITAKAQSKFDTLTAMVQNISAVVDTNNDSITTMVQSKFDTITAVVQNISAVVDTNNDSITAMVRRKFDDVIGMVQRNNDNITAMVQSKFDNITAMVQSKFGNVNAIVLQLQSDLTKLINSDSVQKPASCVDVQKYHKVSGVHTLVINDYRPVKVYCDQSTDNGGWTVIQRRQDGSVDFYRNWEQYETGFGDPNGEFWIGLANLYYMTTNKNSKLRVDLTDIDGSTAYAMYNTFSISGAQDNYRLNVGGYTGTAGDSLEFHNKMQFSTFDKDHDPSSRNCAQTFHGAWWYYAGCHVSGLNSRYKADGTSGPDGINWKYWKSDWRSYKRVEMKIKQ